MKNGDVPKSSCLSFLSRVHTPHSYATSHAVLGKSILISSGLRTVSAAVAPFEII